MSNERILKVFLFNLLPHPKVLLSNLLPHCRPPGGSWKCLRDCVAADLKAGVHLQYGILWLNRVSPGKFG